MNRFLFASLLALTACTPAPKPTNPPGHLAPKGEVLVTVDGHPISQNMVDAITSHVPPEQLKEMLADPANKKRLMDQLVLGEILYQKALERNVQAKPHVPEMLAMAQREVLAQRYLELAATEAVTDEAIQAEYDKQKIRYGQPQVKLLHLVVADEAQATSLIEQLNNGADFATLAREHSLDPRTKTTGGDVGWVLLNRLPAPELKAPLEVAAKGDVIGPIQSARGVHIAKVIDKRDNTPIEEVSPQLEDMVKRQFIMKLTAELPQQAKVEWPNQPGVGQPDDGDKPQGDGAHDDNAHGDAAKDPSKAKPPAMPAAQPHPEH